MLTEKNKGYDKGIDNDRDGRAVGAVALAGGRVDRPLPATEPVVHRLAAAQSDKVNSTNKSILISYKLLKTE